MDLWALIVLPIGLGLLGFIEPCTLGSSLFFVKYLERKETHSKLLETGVFTLTRALFIGTLGALAALVGTAFFDLQHWFWVLLGTAYIVLGLLYLANRQAAFMRMVGPGLGRAAHARGSAVLGVLFGLNIPACAAPLLAALMAASVGAGTVIRGFVVMAIFGLALSLPLVVAVFSARMRQWLDRLAALSDRVPFWTGVVFIVLGTWSIYFGISPAPGARG